MTYCQYCGKPTLDNTNYCGFECMINNAKALGGKIICPNNLPIACILADDSTMMEHEHADHPDYKFPVVIEYFGSVPKDHPDWDPSFEDQTHALIYCDGCIALTMYEDGYDLWNVNTGKGRARWLNGDWKLSDASLEKIREIYCHANS